MFFLFVAAKTLSYVFEYKNIDLNTANIVKNLLKIQRTKKKINLFKLLTVMAREMTELLSIEDSKTATIFMVIFSKN